MDRPLVSVALITYNHANFIRTAIESILMQKTDFYFELIIADDASTDGTTEIVFEYQKKYPQIIKVLSTTVNLGMHRNAFRLWKACRGKYIAFLEGDDFWSYDLKLQRQVDYLEIHKKAMATAHNVLCISESGDKLPNEMIDFPYQKEHKYGKQEALECVQFGHMSSLVFRNFCDILTHEQWRLYNLSTLNGDFKIGLTLGMLGYIFYFEDTWSCRRKVFTGTSWTAMSYNKNVTKFICANYFKAQQYLQIAFGERINISHHLKCLIKQNVNMALQNLDAENIKSIKILIVCYIWSLRKNAKNYWEVK